MADNPLDSAAAALCDLRAIVATRDTILKDPNWINQIDQAAILRILGPSRLNTILASEERRLRERIRETVRPSKPSSVTIADLMRRHKPAADRHAD